jgi:hypothetical protein
MSEPYTRGTSVNLNAGLFMPTMLVLLMVENWKLKINVEWSIFV